MEQPLQTPVSSLCINGRDGDWEMAKEKVDAYSPCGVLEDYLRSAESETDSSKASTSQLDDVEKDSKPTSRWTGIFKFWRSRSKKTLETLHPLNVFKLSRRFGGSMREQISVQVEDNTAVATNSNYFRPQWKNFTLSELQTATNNFSHECLIGKGGYAEVYKGCLRDGQLIAVKRLTRGPSADRVGDFLCELGIMAHVNHPNTAKLIGYGVEGGLHLVLGLSPNGSLASLLHGSKNILEWSIRYKVAVGTAEALFYLHEGCQRRIIHRDVKAANILLTEDFEPQICDFGLAKWLPGHWTHLTVHKFEGTFGYLPPEYLMHGIVDEKTDVFAFGVLLLELITGRRALDYSQQSLLIWARSLLKKNNILELVDPLLGNDYNSSEMKFMVFAARLCVHQSSIQRPRMSQVLQILRGNHVSLESVKASRKLSSWKRYYGENSGAETNKAADTLKAFLGKEL